jgi:hypothetical protein
VSFALILLSLPWMFNSPPQSGTDIHEQRRLLRTACREQKKRETSLRAQPSIHLRQEPRGMNFAQPFNHPQTLLMDATYQTRLRLPPGAFTATSCARFLQANRPADCNTNKPLLCMLQKSR